MHTKNTSHFSEQQRAFAYGAFIILFLMPFLWGCGTTKTIPQTPQMPLSHSADADVILSSGMFHKDRPKREFRGAWLATVTGGYQGLTPSEMRSKIVEQLNVLQYAGINAILFQVRPTADAFYPSTIEPWSRYLTGMQGKAPLPIWDPLQFIIDECHRRGMEMHAWINPYRVKQHLSDKLAPGHLYNKYPERFVSYGDQLFFNPALSINRDYISAVISDIVQRYDVDGIHLDDYFYPYPLPGKVFNDRIQFNSRLDKRMNLGDWRRAQVDSLIRELHQTINKQKPWVKFGVSPFGIYRNKKNDSDGSATNGLENYGDLYADVLLWARSGWIDYLIPQIYWQIGNPVADYQVLIEWWAKHSQGIPLIVGQSVERILKYPDTNDTNKNQLTAKMELQRSYNTVVGSCQWPGRFVAGNMQGYADVLKTKYHKYPALQPIFYQIDAQAPYHVEKLDTQWSERGYRLTWQPPLIKHLREMLRGGMLSQKQAFEMARADKYVIYRFLRHQRIELNDPKYIVAITNQCYYQLPYEEGKVRYYYVVTAMDRLQNESDGQMISVKL